MSPMVSLTSTFWVPTTLSLSRVMTKEPFWVMSTAFWGMSTALTSTSPSMKMRTYWPGMIWPSLLTKEARACTTPVSGCTRLSMKSTWPSPWYMLPSSRRSRAL